MLPSGISIWKKPVGHVDPPRFEGLLSGSVTNLWVKDPSCGTGHAATGTQLQTPMELEVSWYFAAPGWDA